MEFLLALLGGILIFAIIAAIIWSLIFDGLVLFISSLVLHIEDKKTFFWKHIWSVWLFGGLSKMASLFLLNFMAVGDSLFATSILTTLILSGMTFAMHYFLTFKNDDERVRKIMSCIFAVIALLTSI